jgi:hypothetical protein
MEELKISIDFWMNIHKLSSAAKEHYAYDVGIHPDEQRQPSGRRYKHNTKSNNIPENRYHA